jgi:hypothetical protein
LVLVSNSGGLYVGIVNQNGRTAPSMSVMPPDNNESTNLGGSGAGLLEIPTDLINADMSATT